ncbi:hypothetical protein [Pontibacter harenae]|uniref:hypothetical protein n=1 Tax=Pontibacter harenae TaxID=2894083 RepID=UPI001E524E53|nr:hypothetical protein [Pontibacter harenae]MCC9169076.1 hypothetical protein [Pontibacter harenae]
MNREIMNPKEAQVAVLEKGKEESTPHYSSYLGASCFIYKVDYTLNETYKLLLF